MCGGGGGGGGGGGISWILWDGIAVMNKNSEMSTGEAFIYLYISEAFIYLYIWVFMDKEAFI